MVDLSQTPSLTLLDGALPVPVLGASQTAMLIVDMQHYAADRDRGLGARARDRGCGRDFAYYFEQVDRIVPNIASVVDTCRLGGIEVMHLVSEGHTRDGRDLSREYQRRGVLSVKDAPDGAILPQLAPVDDEIVIRKAVAGGFVGTALDFTLRSMGCNTLIIAGVATNQCVESTVRAASHLGYDVVLLEDGCATYSEHWQRFSLESMADQFATVRSSEDVNAWIKHANAAR